MQARSADGQSLRTFRPSSILPAWNSSAVASGSHAKADAAATAFGARTGYADGKDLIQDPSVDIVTIAVKVPDHRELVLAALAAGKTYLLRMAARTQSRGNRALGKGRTRSGDSCRYWFADPTQSCAFASARADYLRRHRSPAQRSRSFHHGRIRTSGGSSHGLCGKCREWA